MRKGNTNALSLVRTGSPLKACTIPPGPAGTISAFRCGKLLTVGRVAQLAEQCPFKAWVDGSNPSALTRFVKRLLGNLFLTKQLGASSNRQVAIESQLDREL